MFFTFWRKREGREDIQKRERGGIAEQRARVVGRKGAPGQYRKKGGRDFTVSQSNWGKKRSSGKRSLQKGKVLVAPLRVGWEKRARGNV